MRTFVALPLSENIKKKIDDWVKNNMHAFAGGIKLVEAQNLHITLQFLGEVSSERISKIAESLRAVSGTVAPFSLNVEGVGFFPPVGIPKVIWIGTSTCQELMQLVDSIRNSLAQIGFAPPPEKFVSHITIGRVKRPLPEIKKLSAPSFGKVFFDRFCLYKSTLTPRGPIYDILEEFKLTGPSSRG